MKEVGGKVTQSEVKCSSKYVLKLPFKFVFKWLSAVLQWQPCINILNILKCITTNRLFDLYFKAIWHPWHHKLSKFLRGLFSWLQNFIGPKCQDLFKYPSPIHWSIQPILANSAIIIIIIGLSVRLWLRLHSTHPSYHFGKVLFQYISGYFYMSGKYLKWWFSGHSLSLYKI